MGLRWHQKSRFDRLADMGLAFARYEQALVSLKLKKSVDAEGGRTFAVIIEGG